MATQENVVQRLNDMSDTMNTVISTQHLLTELLSGHQEQLTAIREDQKTHQKQLTAIREDHNAQMAAIRQDQKALQEHLIALREDHNAQMAVLREDLKTHRGELKVQKEELKEVRLFNEQTRRMWILIAKNMDWLPDDEYFD